MFLKVAPSHLHGQGCFTTRDVRAGETVESAPLLILPPEEMEALHRTGLRDYLFYVRDGATDDGPYYTALAMGPISFCNHSPSANCEFRLDEGAAEITLIARRDLVQGEELTIDYGDYAGEII